MNRIAKFEKVSIGQFTAAWKDTFQERSEEKIREIYETLKLPQRATAGSAGYDFFAPVDLVLAPGETISLPSLLERYGASRGDMEFLATALRRSDDLSITEIEAMQASKGEALCPDGLHSGSDTIDVEYARRLLFNAAYQKRAGEIIKLVESGITSILDRKSHQIEAYKRSVVYHMKELGASIAVVFLIALMWIWYGMKKVSQPLRETTLFAHRVAEGEAESSIAVSGHDEIAELRAMLNVMLSSLQKNALMLRELSYIDPLTALWNRRRFREVLSDELRRVQEEKGKGFGLAFIDVDCFKGINDTFGHAAVSQPRGNYKQKIY